MLMSSPTAFVLRRMETRSRWLLKQPPRVVNTRKRNMQVKGELEKTATSMPVLSKYFLLPVLIAIPGTNRLSVDIVLVDPPRRPARGKIAITT